MFGFGKLKLRGTDKRIVTDGPMLQDHESAEPYGHQGLRKQPRAKVGKLAFYYRDLGKDYYVPYDYIDRSFIRISECQPDDSPAYYYYRLILMHGEKEFANLIFNKEEEVDSILQKLPERNPDTKIGFQAPPDGKRKARFS